MTSPRPIIPRPPSPGSLPATAPEPLFHDLTRDDVFRLETRRLWLRWPRLASATKHSPCTSGRARSCRLRSMTLPNTGCTPNGA